MLKSSVTKAMEIGDGDASPAVEMHRPSPGQKWRWKQLCHRQQGQHATHQRCRCALRYAGGGKAPIATLSSRTGVKGEGFGYDPRERAAAGHLKEGPMTGAVPRERGVGGRASQRENDEDSSANS